jgi:hypothetical protein
LFGSAGRDDAHITSWAAYALSEFGEILNYSFERVEQSSSLLHVVVLAGLKKVSGTDVVLLGRLSSIGAGVVCLPLTYWFAYRLHKRAALLAVWLTGTSSFFVYWAFGGLETTVAAAVVLWWLLACSMYLASSDDTNGWDIVNLGASSLALAAVRPEMPIVIGCVLIGITAIYVGRGWYYGDTVPVKRFLVLGVVSSGACLMLFAFRLEYFGHWFPQPVEAKSGGGITIAQLASGLKYLQNTAYNVFRSVEFFGVTPFGGLTLLLLGAVGKAVKKVVGRSAPRPEVGLSLVFLFAYVSFIVASGGDWMEGGRFLVPVLPVALAVLAWAVFSAVPRESKRIALIGTIGLLQVGALANAVLDYSEGMAAWERDAFKQRFLAEHPSLQSFSWFERYNRDHALTLADSQHLREWVHERGQDLTIASGHMGVVMFYLVKNSPGQIQTVDKFGLVDRRLSSCTVFNDIQSHAVGLLTGYKRLLNRYDAAINQCDLPSIDIIYDLGNRETLSLIERKEYSVLYTSELKEGRLFFGAAKSHLTDHRRKVARNLE